MIDGLLDCHTMTTGGMDIGSHQLSCEEEVVVWVEFSENWTAGATGKKAFSLSATAEDYLKKVVYKAFKNRFENHKICRDLQLPSRDDIWGNVLSWFAIKERCFVSDLICKGIKYGVENRGKDATIEDCLPQIKGRLAQRVQTEFFKYWSKEYIEPMIRLPGKSIDEGTQVGPDDNRLFGDTLVEPGSLGFSERDQVELKEVAKIFTSEMFESALKHDHSRWAPLEQIIGRADRVGFLFFLDRRINAAEQHLRANFGVERVKRFYEEFARNATEIRRKVRKVDGGNLDDEAIGYVCDWASHYLYLTAKEWFFSEKLNTDLFSIYEGRKKAAEII